MKFCFIFCFLILSAQCFSVQSYSFIKFSKQGLLEKAKEYEDKGMLRLHEAKFHLEEMKILNFDEIRNIVISGSIIGYNVKNARQKILGICLSITAYLTTDRVANFLKCREKFYKAENKFQRAEFYYKLASQAHIEGSPDQYTLEAFNAFDKITKAIILTELYQNEYVKKNILQELYNIRTQILYLLNNIKLMDSNAEDVRSYYMSASCCLDWVNDKPLAQKIGNNIFDSCQSLFFAIFSRSHCPWDWKGITLYDYCDNFDKDIIEEEQQIKFYHDL